MIKKLISILLIIFSINSFAQNEFITVWKPSNLSTPTATNNPAIPYQTNANQVWFPGRGTNFNVYWEEVGYPTHNGTMPNVTSTVNFLIDFGAPLNPDPTTATYLVKVSNGTGIFETIKFGEDAAPQPMPIPISTPNGDAAKIIEVSQWGNIIWTNFEYGFSGCKNMDVTATDVPNLSNVTNLAYMFLFCDSFIGNSSFINWNTSNITTMRYMFCIGNGLFNQPIGSWNVSNVTDIGWMFHDLKDFNHPLNNWDTSNVVMMDHVFHGCTAFNQPLNNWDVSNVTNTSMMFANTDNFNQPLDTWDFSSVEDCNSMFSYAVAFNQNLGMWDLNSLQIAYSLLNYSGLDCQNYDNTLYGWRMKPNTPNNINLGNVAPLIYSNSAAVDARNHLINAKGWTLSGDIYNGECESVVLGTTETQVSGDFSIYPNPVSDVLYLKTKEKIKSISVYDVSGKLVMKKDENLYQLNVAHLPDGNYFLTVDFENTSTSVKFIKSK